MHFYTTLLSWLTFGYVINPCCLRISTAQTVCFHFLSIPCSNLVRTYCMSSLCDPLHLQSLGLWLYSNGSLIPLNWWLVENSLAISGQLFIGLTESRCIHFDLMTISSFLQTPTKLNNDKIYVTTNPLEDCSVDKMWLRLINELSNCND